MRSPDKQINRREFLRLAGGAAGLAGFSWLAGALPAEVAEGNDDDGLSFSCAAGDVTSSGAVIWLRAQEEGLVSVHYGREPSLQEFKATPPLKVAPESDFTARILLGGLRPKTGYFYRAALRGKKPGPIGRFVTAPLPDDPADVSFAFSGDSRESYQPFSIMDSIRAMRPDFFMHLGDTIYADRAGRASELSRFWAKYRANRADPPTQRLLSETSLYAIWDDHEVADNYHPAHPLAPVGRRAFFDYWPVRRHPEEADRLYRSFRWGKAVELFLLDTRQYRDPIEGTILGKEQREWLLRTLSSSDAQFKFVATSVPFSSPNKDKWGGFPADRDEVLRVIAERKIKGVIFLTADVHYAAVSRVPGKLGVKEIITGPIAARMGRASGKAKRFEFFSKEHFNYGLVRVHASADPPYAEIAILGERNQLLYKNRIDANYY